MSETYSELGLFISAFISSTIAPGGSEAVLAYLVNQQPTQVMTLVIVATVGNTLGALTTWGLGHWASLKFPADKVLTAKRQQAVTTVRTWGSWALLLTWLPLIGDALCFAGGWLRLSVISGWSAIMLGKALRYCAIAYAFV